MKQLVILTIALLISCHYVAGQKNNQVGRVSISIVTPDSEEIPQAAAQYLSAKMQQIVSTNGMADYGYNGRFILTAKVNVLSKDVTPSTPVRISQKMEVVFMVGDAVDNKLIETASLAVSGIGTSEAKAFISAFQQINTKNEQLITLLRNAEQEIEDYYRLNCESIIGQARTFAAMQEYEKAIYTLITVPNVCNDCYQKCQEIIVPIYKQKINKEGEVLLNKAKSEWMQNPTSEGASRAFALTSAINNNAVCYPLVNLLHDEIGEKLRSDEKREWEFQMKKYEDNLKFKQSIVEACQAIGVAFGQGQPKTVYKRIVGWM